MSECNHNQGLELGITFRCKNCGQIHDEIPVKALNLPENVEQVLKTIKSMEGVKHSEGLSVDELKQKYLQDEVE